MPTTNTIERLVLTNFGEVTSTFTAPEACATHWKNHVHGIGIGEGWPMSIAWLGSCDAPEGAGNANADCFPHGDKVIDRASQSAAQLLSNVINPEAQYTLPYYSPASVCPSNWETVGVAAMSNGTASITGAFSPTVFSSMPWHTGTPDNSAGYENPQRNWYGNMLTTALGPEETAILCCPSGFVVPEAKAMVCVASFDLSEVASSTACAYGHGTESHAEFVTRDSTTVTWSWGSVTSTEIIYAVEVESGYDNPLRTAPITLDGEGHPPTGLPTSAPEDLELIYGFQFEEAQESGWKGVAVQDMLVFIHGGSDDDTDGNEGEDGGDENDDEDNDSAAVATISSVWAIGAAFAMGLMVVAAL